MHGFAHHDFDGAGAEPVALAGLQLAEATDRDGQHVGSALLCEQANAGTERRELSFCRTRAFREDEHVEAAVHGAAGMSKAGLEIAAARQREHIEERGEQKVIKRTGKEEASGWMLRFGIAEAAVVLQHLSGHGHGDLAPQDTRQRILHQRSVERRDVIGDDEQGGVGLQHGRRNHTRGREKPDEGAHHCFDKRGTHPPDRQQPRPARIVVARARGLGFLARHRSRRYCLDGSCITLRVRFVCFVAARFFLRERERRRGLRIILFTSHQAAQFAQCLHAVKHSVFRDDSEPVFDGGGELHASEAVQVQVFGEVQFIAHAWVRLTGDLCDERQQPIF